MTSQADRIDALLSGIRVMPVVVIDSADHALPLADALLEGGVTAIEITFRSEAAPDAVEAIAKHRPDMMVGTGTVLTREDLARSRDIGAKFAVSPGLTRELAEAANEDGFPPLLPGIATASEVMMAMQFGFQRLKFFPAEQAGGRPMLKALSSPLAAVRFCPTGGLTVDNAPDYLALPNVFCVGGSWLTPRPAMANGDWRQITAHARKASAL